MSLFVLAETPAGYGLFKSADKKLFKNDDVAAELNRPEKLVEMLKLKKFVKFESAAMALEEAASLRDGKVPPLLTSLLEDLQSEKKASLAVADAKLGNAISSLPKLNISPVSGSNTMDVFRGIREHLPSLIPGLAQESIDRMSLGLSHSISRHKLKFSVDKIDSMIIQAVRLIDDMDKELNLFAMRTKEWYGWHFPELAKLLNDNIAYARLVVAVGFRANFSETDLSEILPEHIEEAVKKAAEISMGTDITQDDLDNIQSLAEQVIQYTEYRGQLSSYLESRMRAIAPNLTALLGYLVGARLIAHTGSLMNLAKCPGSTIQILGAEKALFRALKTKHETPKYGLIYHSSLIGQATGSHKGKIARMLAAKSALGTRVDALDENEEQDDDQRSLLGVASRIKLENFLRKLEGKPLLPAGASIAPTGEVTTPAKFTLNETRRYNVNADGVVNNTNGETSVKSKKVKKMIEEVEEQSDEDMKDANEGSDDVETVATPAKSSCAKLSTAEYERLAALSGLSVKKFKRKYERGDVQLGSEGSLKVFSKKELKKMRKAEGNGTPLKMTTPIKTEPMTDKKKKIKLEQEDSVKAEPTSDKKKKKRKHEDEDDDETRKEKKHKKKRHSEA
ncbi:hypothetical protein CDD81_6149 [Ophiocordyceps australis]|uniref:Nucleolar protein 58 n=1 Tax=Ophiocordyceps australis TaxID=1399860 RepID=A0A2C5Y7R3_9HYPO|nr:hypothetical protein CDD81_6149 [Ophiocordyceps australis]